MNWCCNCPVITILDIYYIFCFFTDSVPSKEENGSEVFIFEPVKTDIDLDEIDQNLSWLRSDVPITKDLNAFLPSTTGKNFIEPKK